MGTASSATCSIIVPPCAIRDARCASKQSGPCTCEHAPHGCITWLGDDGTIQSQAIEPTCGYTAPVPRRVIWRAKWERLKYGIRYALTGDMDRPLSWRRIWR